MKKLRIIICIALQATIFCFASEKKQFVLSQEGDAWLGDDLNTVLNSEKPQINILSFMTLVVDHVKLVHEGSPYLQKNIDHAKNWLHYFNEKKILDPKDQLEFCRELRDSALYTLMLGGGNKDVMAKIFLEILPLGVDIKNIRSSCISERLGVSPELMNSFIYFYKPSLDFFLEKKSDQGHAVAFFVTRIGLCDERKIFLRTLFTPTLYELTDDKVIRRSYKDVQDIVRKKCVAETFLLALKAKKIKIHKPVLNGIILPQIFEDTVQDFSSRYKSVLEFNAYCNHLEKEVGAQIEWIQKNDPEYYHSTLAPIPFLKNPEAFKEWYEGLKFPKEEK